MRGCLGFAFADACINVLAWRFGVWKLFKKYLFYVCVTSWFIQYASCIAVGRQTIQTVVNVNRKHIYSVLSAHRDMHTHAAPYVGMAAGTEPWGQCAHPAGNLGVLEEKGLYGWVYVKRKKFSLHFIAGKIGEVGLEVFWYLTYFYENAC